VITPQKLQILLSSLLIHEHLEALSDSQAAAQHPNPLESPRTKKFFWVEAPTLSSLYSHLGLVGCPNQEVDRRAVAEINDHFKRATKARLIRQGLPPILSLSRIQFFGSGGILHKRSSRDKQPSFFSSTTQKFLPGWCVGFVLSGKCTMWSWLSSSKMKAEEYFPMKNFKVYIEVLQAKTHKLQNIRKKKYHKYRTICTLVCTYGGTPICFKHSYPQSSFLLVMLYIEVEASIDVWKGFCVLYGVK